MYKSARRTAKRIKNWLNYDPPGSLTSKGWRLFDNEFKEKAPIRHWFKESINRRHFWPLKWKYDAFTGWFRYRLIKRHRYHVVNTGLEPDYYEIETRMLHANFNLLKDFVEVEQAWSKFCWSDGYKSQPWYKKHLPFYRVFFPFRSPELGLEYFEWAATLDDPALPPHERSDQQAKDAREVIALYKWWVEERPARKEIVAPEYDQQGLGILGCFDDDFNRDAPDFKAHTEAMDQQQEQETNWVNEDEEMLIRLIKIRKGLWT